MNEEKIKLWRERHFRYLLLAIFLLGAFLRFYKLGEKSLWFDEIRTYDDARSTTYNFWAKSQMLYFITVGFFLRFGHSEFWLRFVSALFGALAAPVIYIAGKETFDDRRVGLLSAFFIAMSNVHLAFSQEARYYAVMFFLSALSLFLFANFLKRQNIISLLLLPLVCFTNYLIHPTTLVFSGVLFAWVPFSLVTCAQGRAMLLALWRRAISLFSSPNKAGKKKKGKALKKGSAREGMTGGRALKIALMSAVILCLLIIALWSLRHILQIIRNNTRQIRWFRAPAPGVKATFDFFYKDHFIYYGPAVQPDRLLHQYILFFFILFSIVGYIRALIKQFPFASFAIVCILVTFTMLFSFPMGQVYASKYIFFVYPANIMCIMYGFVSVVDFSKKRLVGGLGLNPRLAAILLYSLFLVPQTYKELRLNRGHYLWMRMDVKGVVREAAHRFKPKDIISAYGLTATTVRYYVDYYGIPASQYKELKGEKGDGSRAVNVLLNAALSGGNVWFIFGWPHDIRPHLKEWVEKNFELVYRYRMLTQQPEYDVTLWRWKYPGMVLSEEMPVSLKIAFTPTGGECGPAVAAALAEPAWAKAETELFAHHDIDGLLTFAGMPEDIPTSATLKILLNNKPIATVFKTDNASTETLRASLTLPFGLNHLTLLSRPVPEAKLLKFLLAAAHPENRYFHAAGFDFSTPSYDIECRSEGGSSCLLMPYNAFASYRAFIQKPGVYEFGLRAKNDASGPICYQIEVDDSPVGILAFTKGDDSWEVEKFPLKFPVVASHVITVYYINDTITAKKDAKTNNNSFISNLFLEKVHEGGMAIDQRLNISDETLVPLSKYISGLRLVASPGGVPWQAMGYENPSNERIEVGGRKYDAFKGDIPYNSTGANFLSPPVPVRPGQLLYFTIKGRVKNLGNHSSNVQLIYLDASQQIIGSESVNAQGLTGTVDEVKFICLKSVTPGISQVVVNCAVYANGTRPYISTGQVFFYDFLADRELTRNF
ncbi:MAG: glycosyltransferase family 39 protein [Candidatus Sumerlaeota bacterium]|nr:glycosyltransferase family 39 protein [Candidatus Sumerlaeota bacterium]